MVYLWDIPEFYPNKCIGQYSKTNSIDRLYFKKCLKVCNDKSSLVVNFESKIIDLKKFDVLVSNLLVPIVNDRLGGVIKNTSPNDIQLVDIIVKCKDSVIDDYKILNVLNKILGIDMEKSIFTFIPDTNVIMSIDHLVYKSDVLREFDIARDSDYSSNLIISEKLKTILYDMNLNGISLYQLSES